MSHYCYIYSYYFTTLKTIILIMCINKIMTIDFIKINNIHEMYRYFQQIITNLTMERNYSRRETLVSSHYSSSVFIISLRFWFVVKIQHMTIQIRSYLLSAFPETSFYGGCHLCNNNKIVKQIAVGFYIHNINPVKLGYLDRF